MKYALIIMLSVFGIQSYAADYKALLDFRNLYGNFNAGVYSVDLKLDGKTSDSLITTTQNSRNDDGNITCVTDSKFEVGNLNLSLIQISNLEENDRKVWNKSYDHKLIASRSYETTEGRDDECISAVTLDNSVDEMSISTHISERIELPVKAPKEYEKVIMYLSPFVTGLKTIISIPIGTISIQNPSDFLLQALSNPRNKLVLQYYVAAIEGSSSLSLGNGSVNLIIK